MELDEKKFKKLLDDMYAFRDKAKANGNSKYERISNKDILFFFINKLDSLEERVSKTEAVQRVSFVVFPVIVGLAVYFGKVI
ncbi:hypothetical protein KAX02_01540 [candidate division WOR-3 bacterium]|nr:hypothetical protein [candidate division WOR-3 bacterium]